MFNQHRYYKITWKLILVKSQKEREKMKLRDHHFRDYEKKFVEVSNSGNVLSKMGEEDVKEPFIGYMYVDKMCIRDSINTVIYGIYKCRFTPRRYFFFFDFFSSC